MPHLLKLCLVIAVAIHPFAASAQPADPGAAVSLATQIDATIGYDYKPNEPGAVVLVARDGQTVFRKAYGLADAAKGIPLTPDMQLRLGSITKQFTSTAILMLVDDGKIRLDDPITRFLPDYPMHGQRITIANLLNHTSGIVSYTSRPDFGAHTADDIPVGKMIASFQNDPLEFAPGTRHHYNNSGYFLLGAIIEKVSGQSYADFLDQRIFRPLGMLDTAYEGREHGNAVRAQGHTHGAAGFAPSARISMTQPYAAGALVSTVDDLARWDAAVSAGKLLKPATWQRAFTKTVLLDGTTVDYGYGWAIGTVRGVPTIEHGGGINGFATYALRVPSEHVYVVVLRNTDSGTADPAVVARKAAAVVIGKPFPEHLAITLDAPALDAYVGTYRLDDKRQGTVRRDGGQLSLQRAGRAPVALVPFSPNGFFIPGQLEWVAFSRDADGAVVSMTMHREVERDADRDADAQVLPRVP